MADETNNVQDARMAEMVWCVASSCRAHYQRALTPEKAGEQVELVEPRLVAGGNQWHRS